MAFSAPGMGGGTSVKRTKLGGRYANGAVSGAVQAAMASGVDSPDSNQDAILIQNTDRNAVSNFVGDSVEEREGFVREVVRRGRLGDPRRATYNPVQRVESDGSTPRASTNQVGAITVYPAAFELSYYNFGSALYHEYVHVARYEVYARKQFGFIKRSQPQYMMEAEAYGKMLTPSNPFLHGMTKAFRNEMIGNNAEYGFGGLTEANQARAAAGNYDCSSGGC